MGTSRRTLVTALLAAPIAGAAIPSAASATGSDVFPEVIDLPLGWRPEGIAIGRGTSFYVGSLANGAIYRGSLVTGRGDVFVPGREGGVAVGLEIDARNRIWACGGATGGVAVYDAFRGTHLASYAFGGQFVNDAVATHHAVYHTDSRAPFLHAVPLRRGGRLPDQSKVESIPLPGGLGEEGAFNNGIEVLPDGRLLIVQAQADRIYAFDPRTREATQLDLGGATVLRGDGMVRRGRTLYVVRNFFNTINKFRLSHDFSRATLVAEITDPRFKIPSTFDLFGPWIYAVNARFDTPPTPETPYDIIRVPA